MMMKSLSIAHFLCDPQLRITIQTLKWKFPPFLDGCWITPLLVCCLEALPLSFNTLVQSSLSLVIFELYTAQLH